METGSTIGNKHVVSGSDWQVMPRIYDQGVNLSVLTRSLAPEVRTFVREKVLNDRPLSICQSITGPEALPSLLPEHLREAPGARPWLEDMMMLADAWFSLFGATAAGVRLTTLSKTMCPRFHADRVMVRLLTTYGGPGTEWLPNDEVDRASLGRPLGPHGDPMTESDRVERLGEGDVGLLKGEIWPGNEGNGVVHRSPSLTANERRLLFSLDIV